MTQRPVGPTPPTHPPAQSLWPPPRRPHRALLPQLIELALIIGFLVGGYHGLLFIWEYTAPKEVKVPGVVGIQQREAAMLLARLGLRAEVIAEKPSEEVPAGAVMEAEPAPGRMVKVGRTIRLTVSAGSRWARVPDVSDMSVDRAEALLRQAGLVVKGQRARYHRSVPAGYVIGQRPSPDERVPRGSEVELTVSRGPRPATEVAEEHRSATEGTRSTDIELTVPPGASLQEVKIIVQDRNGTHVAYEAYHEPGETVRETVSGEGPSIVVQVYLSGLLVERKSI